MPAPLDVYGLYGQVQVEVKLPRVMARKKFLKLTRLMRYAKEANLRAVFTCPHCNEVVKLRRGETGLIELAPGDIGPINSKKDAFTLVCRCTTWTVRG